VTANKFRPVGEKSQKTVSERLRILDVDSSVGIGNMDSSCSIEVHASEAV
jgi:hypothetical protein